MNNHLQSRQNVIKGIFITIVIILVSKLFYMQLIMKEKYEKSAKDNIEVGYPLKNLTF